MKAPDAMIESERFFNSDGSVHIDLIVMDYSSKLDTSILGNVL